MSLRDEDFRLKVAAYQAQLQGMGAAGRRDFVDVARRNEDWPEPREGYLASHARKHGRGLRPEQYAQRAYDIKNKTGVFVLAYIHAVHRNRGLAFDCDLNLNFDLITPTNGTRSWVKDRTTIGTHWRLRDTEL